MQPITKNTIERLASLSRIALTPAECEAFAEDLSSLASLARQLEQIPVDAEVSGAVDLSVLREDREQKSLDRDELLSLAFTHDAEAFVVPRTVEE